MVRVNFETGLREKRGCAVIIAGSMEDKEIIKAGNDHEMTMRVLNTGERCFLH